MTRFERIVMWCVGRAIELACAVALLYAAYFLSVYLFWERAR